MFFFSPAKETFHQKQKSDFLGYSFSNITKISCRKLQGKIIHFLAWFRSIFFLLNFYKKKHICSQSPHKINGCSLMCHSENNRAIIQRKDYLNYTNYTRNLQIWRLQLVFQSVTIFNSQGLQSAPPPFFTQIVTKQSKVA